MPALSGVGVAIVSLLSTYTGSSSWGGPGTGLIVGLLNCAHFVELDMTGHVTHTTAYGDTYYAVLVHTTA